MIASIVQAISDDVSRALFDAGLAPLADGRILIGPEYIDQAAGVPRIVFVPLGSDVSAAAASFASSDTSNQLAYQLARVIGADKHSFEVHVWGHQTPPDSTRSGSSYTSTQLLANQVRRSAYRLFTACASWSAGKWDRTVSELVTTPRRFVFGLQVLEPLADLDAAGVPNLSYPDSSPTMSGTATLEDS